ncbi:hypothetical protein BJX70DRAFT_395538 [Aspergillus crustosus]
MPPRLIKLPASSFRGARILRPSSRVPLRSISCSLQTTQQLSRPTSNLPKILNSPPNTSIRAFSSTPSTNSPPSTSSGKSQADLIVEELQELYETATDELEIATESTDAGTIYAASDRESARDALNALIAAYDLYTSPEVIIESATPGLAGENQSGSPADSVGGVESEGGRLVELGVDPADVSDQTREEVRKRVGQRVREVRSAVEGLEGRVHD